MALLFNSNEMTLIQLFSSLINYVKIIVLVVLKWYDLWWKELIVLLKVDDQNTMKETELNRQIGTTLSKQ